MTWFNALLEFLNGVLKQITYVEGLQEAKQKPEAIYEKNKEAMDEALSKNDDSAIDLLINDVLPPPQGGINPQ
jgi:hypothetical protein